MSETKKWLRDTDVAARLGVHRNTVRRLAREDSGFPSPRKLGARMTRWDRDAIERWESQTEIAHV